MARTLRIPLGNIAPDDLAKIFEELLQRCGAELQRELGPQTQWAVETETLQNEVLPDNKTVALKIIRKRLSLRQGYGSGADVDLVWRREHPGDVAVELRTMSTLIEHSLYGAIGLAGIFAFVVGGQIGSKGQTALVIFGMASAVMMVPYFILRIALSAFAQGTLSRVEEIVVRQFAAVKG